MTLRRGALIAALLLCACARRPPPPAAATAAGAVRIDSRGAVSTLQLVPGRLLFCDAAGMHEIALPGGRVLAQHAGCPIGDQPRPALPEVTVRTPDHGADDIVEVDGVALSFPIEGHARDWAVDATGVLVVATASKVIGIATTTNRRVTLSERGAERVAAGGGCTAWWDGAAVFARKL